MWQQYFTLTSISEALTLLSERAHRARIIAGGTDLLLELERGARPDVEILIDVSRIPGLDRISVEDNYLSLGPLVTHNQIVGSDLVRRHAFPLAQAAWEVGAPAIRNRATVAGNVITASPANDTVAPLLALDAEISLASLRGERIVALRDFYTGYRQIDMRPDEMLTAIRIPLSGDDAPGIFLKLGLRRAQAISVLNVAVVLRFEDPADRRSLVQEAAVAMGCVGPVVTRLTELEDFLKGRQLSSETIQAAAGIGAGIPQPIDDIRSTAEYRVEMIRVYLARALHLLRDGNERAGLPEDPAMLWGRNRGSIQSALPDMVCHERDHAETITTTVNGQVATITGATHKTLLHFLRDELKLTGVKEGCSEGECGACTVFLDGVAVMACMVPAPRAHGATIDTVEGLVGEHGGLHPLQDNFVNAGAVQCGYCTPGFIMSGVKLLEEYPQPSRIQIEQALSGNLCRCTGYYKILDAINMTSSSQGGKI